MPRVLLVLVVSIAVSVQSEALTPGAMLDASNASEADGLLPPEVVGRYKSGQFKNRIAEWPNGPAWDDAFETASRKNAGRLDVNEHGTIVDNASGKQATGLYGLPFAIDRADPKAGVKVMWNVYYALWRIASTHDMLSLVWVGPKTKQREAVLESHL